MLRPRRGAILCRRDQLRRGGVFAHRICRSSSAKGLQSRCRRYSSRNAVSSLGLAVNLRFVKTLYYGILSISLRGQLLPIQVDEEDIPFFAEVIAGGSITIPEEIRKIFGVKDGDHVMCRVRLVKRAEDVK